MQFLFAVILKAIAALKKVFAFLSKEFFLVFIYIIIGFIISLLTWLLLKFVFPNKEIYLTLETEFKNLKINILLFENIDIDIFIFLFVITIACIYLYRVLLTAVQGAVLK
jgi:hypothetical protein